MNSTTILTRADLIELLKQRSDELTLLEVCNVDMEHFLDMLDTCGYIDSNYDKLVDFIYDEKSNDETFAETD